MEREERSKNDMEREERSKNDMEREERSRITSTLPGLGNWDSPQEFEKDQIPWGGRMPPFLHTHTQTHFEELVRLPLHWCEGEMGPQRGECR